MIPAVCRKSCTGNGIKPMREIQIQIMFMSEVVNDSSAIFFKKRRGLIVSVLH